MVTSVSIVIRQLNWKNIFLFLFCVSFDCRQCIYFICCFLLIACYVFVYLCEWKIFFLFVVYIQRLFCHCVWTKFCLSLSPCGCFCSIYELKLVLGHLNLHYVTYVMFKHVRCQFFIFCDNFFMENVLYQ